MRGAFRRENLPRNRAVRIGLGVLLSVGGVAGIVLPVLGLWMLPLGITVLSVDIPGVRRVARKVKVKWGHARGKRARTQHSGPSARERGRKTARA